MKKIGGEDIGDLKISKHENQIATLLLKMQERRKTKRLSANGFKRIKVPTEKFLSFQKSVEKSTAKMSKKSNVNDSSKKVEQIKSMKNSKSGTGSRRRKPNPKYDSIHCKPKKAATNADTKKRQSKSKSSKLENAKPNHKLTALNSRRTEEPVKKLNEIEKRKRIPNSKYQDTVIQNNPKKSNGKMAMAMSKQAIVIKSSSKTKRFNSEDPQMNVKTAELNGKRLRIPNRKYEVPTSVNSKPTKSKVTRKGSNVSNPMYYDSIPDKVSILKISKADKLEDEFS